MTFGGTGEPAPVAHAFAVMLADFDQLVKLLADGGMEDFDDRGSVGFMQDFERFRNRLSLVDHQLIADGVRRDLPTALCQGSMRRVLTSALGLSKVEAARRIRAAEAVGPRTSMLGEIGAGPAGAGRRPTGR